MKNLLKNKLYLSVFTADLISNFGDVLYYLALMAYVLHLPDAKLGIALISLSETLPILSGFFMGYLADKTRDKVSMIIYTQLFRVVLYLLMGVLMGYHPSLWVVVVAVIINLLSDLSGQYENGLYTPVGRRIVSDEDRADGYAFRQGVSAVCQIIFQSAGAALVGLLTYRSLAFLNAGTFALSLVVMLMIRASLDKLLKDRPIKQETTSQTTLFKDLWASLTTALKTCLAIPEIRASMVIVPLLNAIFSVFQILTVAIISQDPNFVILTPTLTLALMTILMMVGGIVGSILAMTLLKNLSIFRTLRLVSLLVPILFISLYSHQIYGLYLTLFLTMILCATINPKMNALIVNQLPEEKLAQIDGGISTYFQLGSLVVRVVVSGLIVLVPVDWISLGFLVIGFGTVYYAYFRIKEVGTTS